MVRWGGRDRGECCVVVPVGCLFAVMPVVLRSGAPVCTWQSEVASCARTESRPLADPVLPPVQGHPHLDRGAGPRPRVYARAAAQHLGPLPYGPQAHAPRGGSPTDGPGIEAGPVVLHPSNYLAVADVERYPYARAARVPHGVPDRLAHRQVGLQGDVVRDR